VGGKIQGPIEALWGPPAKELKTLKIYISAKYNYLKICITFSLLSGNF
jgi:hypothetical protein